MRPFFEQRSTMESIPITALIHRGKGPDLCGKRLSREGTLASQARAWEMWQAGRELPSIALELGVKADSARQILRREHKRLTLVGEASESELERFQQTIGLGESRGGRDPKEIQRQYSARQREARLRTRPAVLVRVSVESVYLPGQLALLIGGQGDADGGCVRVRSQQTRGEYFIPKSFLQRV